MSAPATAPAGDRLTARFAALAAEGRGGLVTFVTAGDPDGATSLAILKGLPGAGADIVELGMPFSDPVADGPAIQAAGQRALAAGQTMIRTLAMVRDFRADDTDTPLVLMGYFNPIHHYGVARFIADAIAAGVDGLIVVDLPPEEDADLYLPARAAGLHVIRLVAPNSDDARLAMVLAGAGGFVYHVAIAGITGTRSADTEVVRASIARLRRHSDLPIAVGFGIKTPAQAGEMAALADAAVVGSALVGRIADGLDDDGRPGATLVADVLAFAAALAAGVRETAEPEAGRQGAAS